MDEGYTRDHVVAFHKMPGRYYTMDLGSVMGMVLDGNDGAADGRGGYPSNIADDQLVWIEAELAMAKKTSSFFPIRAWSDRSASARRRRRAPSSPPRDLPMARGRSRPA